MEGLGNEICLEEIKEILNALKERKPEDKMTENILSLFDENELKIAGEVIKSSKKLKK